MSGAHAPSCALLGEGAAILAATAVRRSRGGPVPALLVRWGTSGGRVLRYSVVGRALRSRARLLAASVPADWVVTLEGAAVAVFIPADAGPACVFDFVRTYDGPVAIAIGAPRCDGVDAVLRTVDEVVLVEPAIPALLTLAREELVPLVRTLTVVPPPRSRLSLLVGGQDGQSTVVALAVVATLLAVAAGLGIVATALGRTSDVQGRADVAALAGAKAMLEAQPLLYTPDPRQHIDWAEYRARGERAAMRTAEANGLRIERIAYVGDADMPTRIHVTALSLKANGHTSRHVRSTAEVVIATLDVTPGVGEYPGPFAIRQGQRMRPDVALGFDRFNAAATAAGHPLVIVSAFRSDAEQAALFAKHPDPKWVAPPGKSLHRLGTELDLGPASAYAWIDANGMLFGFKQRYSWEAWHMGWVRSPGSASLGYGAGSTRVGRGAATRSRRVAGRRPHEGSPESATEDDASDSTDGSGERATRSAIPAFVPSKYAPLISAASQQWSVGAALLGAQLKVESNFNPNARSSAGGGGIAQFTIGTATMYGLTAQQRFDPALAILAQAHLMHDLLVKFGSVPLALAAYNAGEGRVSPCMCVPAIPETQAYVQKILALLGAGGLSAAAGLQIRLVA